MLMTGAVTQEVVVECSVRGAADGAAAKSAPPSTKRSRKTCPQLISGENRQIDQFIFLTPGVTGGGFSHRIDGGVDQQTEIMFNGVPEAFSETQGLVVLEPAALRLASKTWMC